MSSEQTAIQKKGTGFLAPAARPVTATANTEAERAIAEVKGAITIAMANPRNQAAAVERIRGACRRPTLAAAAIYAYPRGGTTVTGPSIRLAEALAQNWGNLQFGVRELSSEGGKSTLQAYAWDMETNVRAEKTFEIPHVRYTREHGNTRLVDPRDIYEAVANQGARRLRACILEMIPGDVVEMAVSECGTTQEAEQKKDGKPLAERIKGMLEAFGKLGVDRQKLESYFKHKLEDCSTAELISVGRILTSIQDGVAKPAEYFPVKAKEPAADVRAQVAQRRGGLFGGRGKPEPEQEPEREPGQDDEGQGEIPY